MSTPTEAQSQPEAPAAPLSDEPIKPPSDELAASLDKALETEFPPVSDADPTPEELAAPPEEEAAPPATPENPVVEVKVEPKAEEKPAEDPISRGMAVLAKREKEVRQEAENVKAVRIENQTLKSQKEADDKLAIEDPASFFEARGIQGSDLAFVAAQLYVKAMGDKAPKAMVDEIRARGDSMTAKREVAQLKAREAERERQFAQQQAQNRALGYLHSIARAIPDSLPHLQAEAKEDPAGAAEAMYHRINFLIQKGELDPSVNTDEEMTALAADSLNKQLRAAAERHEKLHATILRRTAPPPKTPTPVAEKKQPAAPKTLTSTTATPTKTPKKAPASRDELADEIARELSQGKHLGSRPA